MPQPDTVAVLCDLDEAEMLLQVAKHFCPGALPEIEKEIRLARQVLDSGNLSRSIRR